MEDAVRRLPHPRTETIIHIFINLYRLINPFRFCYLARGPLLRAGLFGSDGWGAPLATTKSPARLSKGPQTPGRKRVLVTLCLEHTDTPADSARFTWYFTGDSR